jgi:hypothetical protein
MRTLISENSVMQRIDENTYIDDTLVTCAEYQLFIDEMHEQGEFYQPDHWTTSQFPSCYAKVPILGVRFNDAKAFCKWLTRRDTGEWLYRLPSANEAEQYLLAKPVQSSLGYWIIGSRGEAKFAWIGSTPENPRKIDAYLARDLDRNLFAREIDISHNISRDYTIALVLDRALDLNLASSFANELSRARDLTKNLDRALDLAVHSSIIDEGLVLDINRILKIVYNILDNLDNNFDRSHDFDPNRELARNLVKARDLAIDLYHAHDLANVRDRARDLVRNLDYTDDPDLVIVRNRARKLDARLTNASDLARDLARSLTQNLSLDLFLDILTLQERIAGRSPAFEGIRLVKERKKP